MAFVLDATWGTPLVPNWIHRLHRRVLAHLPYPNDEQLVRIYQQHEANRWTLSDVDVQAIEHHARSFSAVGAVRTRNVAVAAGGGGAEPMNAGYMTAGFLEALGVGLAA